MAAHFYTVVRRHKPPIHDLSPMCKLHFVRKKRIFLRNVDGIATIRFKISVCGIIAGYSCYADFPHSISRIEKNCISSG